MIIENPIVIEMKNTYKFKPKYVPSNEYLLKKFGSLQLDPSNRYLYSKHGEFDAKKAIDLMAFTFESNKFLIIPDTVSSGYTSREYVVKIRIRPIHPLEDNYALEPGAYSDYCKWLDVKMDYTEASMFYENPVKWISDFIEKFGIDAWSAPIDDILAENLWKWAPVYFNYDNNGQLQPRYVTPSDAWNGAKIPSPYYPTHPSWGSNNVQPLYGAPIPSVNLQATYDNILSSCEQSFDEKLSSINALSEEEKERFMSINDTEFGKNVQELIKNTPLGKPKDEEEKPVDPEEIQKACYDDPSFAGVHEPLSDIFGGPDKSENS